MTYSPLEFTLTLQYTLLNCDRSHIMSKLKGGKETNASPSLILQNTWLIGNVSKGWGGAWRKRYNPVLYNPRPVCATYRVINVYIKNNASSNDQLALKLLQILCVYKVQNVIILPENWQMIDECETIRSSITIFKTFKFMWSNLISQNRNNFSFIFISKMK